MVLSQEEVDFFSNMFSDDVKLGKSHKNIHTLSVKSNTPSVLSQLFEKSRLTLLAEVSHYQLWFPLDMTVVNGEFKPILGTPEIIDIENGERSWRGEQFKNVTLTDLKGKNHHLLSLSSTGIAFRVSDRRCLKRLLNDKTLIIDLPNHQKVALEFEVVRLERDLIAAKITRIKRGEDKLKKFIFNLHRSEHLKLYQDLYNP